MQADNSYEFRSIIEESTNKLWGAHFAIPQFVSTALTSAEDRRVICTLNDKITYQCAMLPYGDGVYVISVNKKIRDQLKLMPGSHVSVSLRKDDSTYGLPMPEELAEVLRQDAEADRLFHELSPGKLRTLLYIVANVKSSEKRISRAFAIAEHLKSTGGKIDYKKLNLDLKGS